MRVLVLGGYGFIGAEIVRGLCAEGFDVVGLGRDADLGRRLLPNTAWIGADIANLTTAADWAAHLINVDAIVNAAGALQDGIRDDLTAVHDTAIKACIVAAEEAGVKTFVQISAAGATADASTAFMRTKAAGDAALRASNLDWVIFKPGLVIGANAYGGTSLLRMLAGIPLVTPLVHAGARIQTVAADDVAAAVVSALKGEVRMCADYDLVEDEPHELREIVSAMRAWLGFKKARLVINAPRFLAGIASFAADIAGGLGWRSPLRSTALKVTSENVLGDPAPWREASGRSCKSLEEILLAMPATAQERIYARVRLLLPIIIFSLSGFWIASGIIAIMEAGRAAEILTPAISPALAFAAVYLGALVDIGVGALLLLKRTARVGAYAGAGVAAFYIAAGTKIAPEFWFDPFGVYVKVLPVIVLSLTLGLLLQER